MKLLDLIAQNQRFRKTNNILYVINKKLTFFLAYI